MLGGPLTLAPLVIRPIRFGFLDVFMLRILDAATEQDDQRSSVLAEINPIAGTIINLQFQNTFANATRIAEIAKPNAPQSRFDLLLGSRIAQRFEPIQKWCSTSRSLIDPQLALECFH